MNFSETAARLAERAPLPDAVLAGGMRYLIARTRKRLASATQAEEARFVQTIRTRPIAEHTGAANQQHYEVPAEFFEQVLGPHRKYSSCLYPTGSETLEQAERAALAETVAHADLADGQAILELGCGWGSLSLFMAAQYPNASVTSVSNSASQRACIEALAAERGIQNLRVITADMNEFTPDRPFDRVVSVEMFEHMTNWPALLGRVKGWLKPEGRLFLHVFTHRTSPYLFDVNDRADWIAQHFFTGGIMPSHGLLRHFGDLFTIEQEWRWNGTHYRRTALDWLANMDANEATIRPILAATYGSEARVWWRRWRMFFLATAELFGHAGGEEWAVSHYRLAPAGGARS